MSGRHEWPNRDPIQEQSGFNLYEYVGDNSINIVDLFGLAGLPWRQGGAAQYYRTHNQPFLPDYSFGLSGGFYAVAGADVSYSWSTCCKNGRKYKVEVCTVCSGLGLQGKGKIEAPERKDLAPTPSASSGGDCPQNRHYLKVEGDIGPADFYGNYWPGSGLDGGGDYSLGMGLDVKLVYCSDTVMSMVPE